MPSSVRSMSLTSRHLVPSGLERLSSKFDPRRQRSHDLLWTGKSLSVGGLDCDWPKRSMSQGLLEDRRKRLMMYCIELSI